MEFLVYLPPKLLLLFLEHEFMKFQLTLIAVNDFGKNVIFRKVIQ